MIPQVNLDFQVHDTGDPRVLSVMDYSVWSHLEDKPTIIEIILPGDSDPVVHYFEQGAVNIFNSQTLGVNCVGCDGSDLLDLDDGIYQITLKGSPDSFQVTKHYLRTTKVRLDLDRLFIKSGLGCNILDCNSLQELVLPDLLLKAAAANVRFGDICKANQLFEEALELVEEKTKC